MFPYFLWLKGLAQSFLSASFHASPVMGPSLELDPNMPETV